MYKFPRPFEFQCYPLMSPCEFSRGLIYFVHSWPFFGNTNNFDIEGIGVLSLGVCLHNSSTYGSNVDVSSTCFRVLTLSATAQAATVRYQRSGTSRVKKNKETGGSDPTIPTIWMRLRCQIAEFPAPRTLRQLRILYDGNSPKNIIT